MEIQIESRSEQRSTFGIENIKKIHIVSITAVYGKQIISWNVMQW